MAFPADSNNARPWFRSKAAWVLLVGLIFSTGWAYFLATYRERQAHTVLHFKASLDIGSLRRELASNFAIPEAIRAFYNGSVSVEWDEFKSFAQPFFESKPALEDLGYLARLPRNDAATRQRILAQMNRPSLDILVKQPNGLYAPAPNHPDETYLLCQLESSDPLPMPLGWNAASDPAWQTAIQQACNLGDKASFFEWRRNPHGKGDTLCVTVLLPVFRRHSWPETPAARRENLEGLAFAVFAVDPMVRTALAENRPFHSDIALYGPSASGKDDLLYTLTSPRRSPPFTPSATLEEALAAPNSQPFEFIAGGVPWRIVCTPPPAAVRAIQGNGPVIILLAGVIVTALLAMYVRAREAVVVHHEAAEQARRQTESVLQESEERFQHLFENLPDPCLLMVAEPGTLPYFTDCNQAALELFGVPDKTAFLGRRPCDLSPEFQPDGQSSLEKSILISGAYSDGSPRRFEWLFQRADGTTFPVDVTLTPTFYRGRLLVYTVWRDIAEYKRLQNERDRLVDELAERNKELESVVYVASHDLRSPIINLQGFTLQLEALCRELLEHLTAPAPACPHHEPVRQLVDRGVPSALNRIMSSARKMEELVRGMVQFSRAGREDLRMQRVEMQPLIRSILGAMAFQIEQIGASVEVGPLPACYGDPARLNQVFSNLLDNAIKYRDPERKLNIRITGRTIGETSFYEVEDTGLGIAENHQGKIWELFHRLDPRGDVPGEGLGLTLVRRIIERHHGRIRLESEPGRGSRFLIELPHRARTITAERLHGGGNGNGNGNGNGRAHSVDGNGREPEKTSSVEPTDHAR